MVRVLCFSDFPPRLPFDKKVEGVFFLERVNGQRLLFFLRHKFSDCEHSVPFHYGKADIASKSPGNRKIQRTQTLSSSYAEKAGTQKMSSPSAEIILMEYGLTPREIEVAKMLCSNRNTTKEISQSLNISVNTAATHIKHIYEKCAVNSKFSLYRLINDEITQSGDERSEGKIT